MIISISRHSFFISAKSQNIDSNPNFCQFQSCLSLGVCLVLGVSGRQGAPQRRDGRFRGSFLFFWGYVEGSLAVPLSPALGAVAPKMVFE